VGPLRALLLVLVAIQLACGSTRTIRYRLPLAGNPGAAVCYAECSELRTANDDDAFLRCLSRCPGIEQTANARCDLDAPNDRPPMATCMTATDPQLGSARNAIAGIILGMAVFVLGISYVGKATDNRNATGSP
jgi:hypothetical protein